MVNYSTEVMGRSVPGKRIPCWAYTKLLLILMITSYQSSALLHVHTTHTTPVALSEAFCVAFSCLDKFTGSLLEVISIPTILVFAPITARGQEYIHTQVCLQLTFTGH